LKKKFSTKVLWKNKFEKVFAIFLTNKIFHKMFFSSKSAWNRKRRMIIEYFLCRKPPERVSEHLEIRNFNDESLLLLFRFNGEQLSTLLDLFQFPETIYLDNGMVTCGEECLLITLRRLVYPNRLFDLQNELKVESSRISRIMNYTQQFLMNKYRWRLEISSLMSFQDLFIQFSNHIRLKGCPLTNIIGFIDGTPRAICRPSHHQGNYYSGHKRFHCVKFQAITIPNGIISVVDGPYPGRNNDSGMLSGSGLSRYLELNLYFPNGRRCALYADGGYPLREYLLCPYKGNIDEMQIEFNRQMASVRISVEWSFNIIIQLFAFLDFKKNLKLELQDIGDYYLLGSLLSNCHTCFNGNQISCYFGIDPPDIRDYLLQHH